MELLSVWPESIVEGTTIYCPCLAGLPAHLALTLAALPIHDANAKLLSGLAKRGSGPPPDYAGVFFADPFRKLDDILASVRGAGIGGVVNMPSVSGLLERSPDEQLARFHRRETVGLRRAREAGFRILCVVPDWFAKGMTEVDVPANCPTINLGH